MESYSAVFDGRMFVPEGPASLAPNSRVRVTVELAPAIGKERRRAVLESLLAQPGHGGGSVGRSGIVATSILDPVEALLDTNLLAGYTDVENPRHGAVARFINETDLRLFVAPQSLYEYWVVATRPRSANGWSCPLAPHGDTSAASERPSASFLTRSTSWTDGSISAKPAASRASWRTTRGWRRMPDALESERS